MYWLLGRRSKLSLENKILLYNSMIKPVWMYGIELWGSASLSNVNIIQRFENKVLRQVTNAPWYVTNETIRNDLRIPDVKTEIQKQRRNYAMRLQNHPNTLARDLLKNTGSTRLKRKRLPDF
uniref:Putative reverse transcriptase n=1 Tax=Phlebotomus kandelakii TaxID=1109342 RepID=A0A6B2EET6_9DIPT